MALVRSSHACVTIIGLVLAELLCESVVSGSASSQFLRPSAPFAIDGISYDEANALSSEIESLFGRDATQSRLLELKDVLRPVYLTLSSDGKRGLGHAATRYALHRYFQKRHGWMVTGLADDGRAWNGSSATEFLQGRVPASLREIFDERLAGNGLDLQGVAVLAATVEHLVRVETVTRLEQAYDAFQLPKENILSNGDVDRLMDMHMVITFFGNRVSLHKLPVVYKMAHKVYPGWADTQMFLRDLRQNVAFEAQDKTNPFTQPQPQFDYMLRLVEASSDQFGQFQDLECQALNQLLLTVEHRGTGRVRLADFYGLAVSGYSQFAERPEYLRDTGVLDETDEANPSVVIPNWLYSKANCLGSSTYYSICCVNHCNGLIAHLEGEFRKPIVDPKALAAAVALLSSATVSAPRNLSETMLHRLEDIASAHGGAVPLHGRLFAQWMHLAFPRECPYPHVAGSVQVVDTNQWKKANAGQSGVYTPDQIAEHGTKFDASKFSDDDEDGCLDTTSWLMDEVSEQEARWDWEEEIFLELEKNEDYQLRSHVLRSMAICAATVSIIAVLIQSVISAASATPAGDAGSKPSPKYVV